MLELKYVKLGLHEPAVYCCLCALTKALAVLWCRTSRMDHKGRLQNRLACIIAWRTRWPPAMLALLL
jgi:hypothetical protein